MFVQLSSPRYHDHLEKLKVYYKIESYLVVEMCKHLISQTGRGQLVNLKLNHETESYLLVEVFEQLISPRYQGQLVNLVDTFPAFFTFSLHPVST